MTPADGSSVRAVSEPSNPSILGVDEVGISDLLDLGLPGLVGILSFELVGGDDSGRDVNGDQDRPVVNTDVTFGDESWLDSSTVENSGGVIESALGGGDDGWSVLGSSSSDYGSIVVEDVVEDSVVMVVGVDLSQVVVSQLSEVHVSEDSELVVGSAGSLVSVSHVVSNQVLIIVGFLRSVDNSELELVLDVEAVILVETDLGDDVL